MTDFDFEEFEFKPLTEGLGFHKKAEKIKTDIKGSNLGRETTARAIPEVPPRSMLFGDDDAQTASQPAPRSASQSISELMASLPPSLDFLDDKQDLTRSGLTSRPASTSMSTSMTTSAAAPTPAAPKASASAADADRPQIYQPLARKEEKPASQITGVLPSPGTKAGMSATSASAAIPAPMAPSPYREKLNASYARAFPHAEGTKTNTKETEVAPNAEGLIPVSANFAAILIDAMVVAGIATVFLVCILTITKINLVGLLTNAHTDGATRIHLVTLTLAVMQMYMLVSRAFFGASLGEWAFEMQLGSEAQQRKPIYPLQVIARTLVTTLTGLILLPLLSFGFGRDIAKYFTGAQLYRRP